MGSSPPVDVDLRDELDASVECGSGCICLFGPPGSGKTTLLLDYLVAREDRVRRLGRAFRLEYATARALDGDAAAHFARLLSPRAKRPRGTTGPRLSAHPALHAAAAQWLRDAPAGSELHLVLDDADAMATATGDAEAFGDACDWPSGAKDSEGSNISNGSMGTVGTGGRRGSVCVWLVAQAPLRVAGCFRRHFAPAPAPSQLARWAEQRARPGSSSAVGAVGSEDTEGSEGSAHRAVCGAVAYYAAHLPMRAGLVAHDVRRLLVRAHTALPRLAALSADGRAPNPMHFAAAWAQPQPRGGTASSAAEGARSDPLAAALARVGLSAALLAVAAFYCGAVPRARHAHVFDMAAEGTRRAQANAASHKAAVLSSTAHTVRESCLMRLYDGLLRICVHHIDPLELAAADVAVMHVQTLVSWRLLVPLSQGARAYRCHVPVTSAVELAKLLSLSLYDLIPV